MWSTNAMMLGDDHTFHSIEKQNKNLKIHYEGR
jgi:hypothetical protein